VRKRNLFMAAGACLAALTLMAPAAFADPASPKLLAGVGSVTTQNVLNALAAVIPSIGNYEGTGSATLPATKAAIAGSTCTGIPGRPVPALVYSG
jgi:hypothetical protein